MALSDTVIGLIKKGIKKLERGDLFILKEALEKEEIVSSYLWLKNLRPEEYIEIREEWDQYYKECWESESGVRFRLAKEALKERDTAAVKHFSKEAREALIEGKWTVKKPQSPNPYELEHNKLVMFYQAVNSAITALDTRTKKDYGDF